MTESPQQHIGEIETGVGRKKSLSVSSCGCCVYVMYYSA